MNSFDMTVHIEETYNDRDYAAYLWEERIAELERIFKQSVISLLTYKRVASDTAFFGAAFEAYENASEDVKEYLLLHDIDTFPKFLIYLDGITMGIEVRNVK